jgi:hypothetical protein
MATVFGWGRRPAVAERAKLIARMVRFTKHGMRTKSYEQFVEAFSNTGADPDAFKRHNRESQFTMTVSSTCWYSAIVRYPHDAGVQPFMAIQGGGDDYGVFITTGVDELTTAELHVPSGQRPGRDAGTMVKSLLAMPGWAGKSEFERLFGD